MSLNNEKTQIFLKGALEPILMREPLQATMMNMSAAINNNNVFFAGTNIDGKTTVIAIPQITHMIDLDEDDD